MCPTRGSSVRRHGVWADLIGVALAVGLATAAGCHGRQPADPLPAPDHAVQSARQRSSSAAATEPTPIRIRPLTAEGEAALRQGAAALEAGRPGAAQQAFEHAARCDPDSRLVHDYLGIAFLQQRRLAPALHEFQEEVRLDPASSTGWARVADVYYARSDVKHAVEAMQRAVALGPNVAQLHMNLAMLYQRDMQLNQAVEEMTRCVVLVPDNHYAHYVRGNLLYKMAKLDDAESDLKEAIRLDPQVGLYHFALAQVFLRRVTTPETTEMARTELETALRIGVTEPAEIHYNLGLCYQRQGKFEDARRELATAVRMAPKAWSAYYALGDVLLRLGKTAEAARAQARFRTLRAAEDARMKRSFYTQEVERQPDSPEARIQLAEYLAQSGERTRARAALDEAKRLASAGKADPGIQARIAALSSRLGQPGR